MRSWLTVAALLALWAPMLGCCYGPAAYDPCGGWAGGACGAGTCGSCGAYGACGGGCGGYVAGQGPCCLIGQAIGCLGSGISCVGREVSCLGQMAGGGACAPCAADPCYSSCVPQTFDTYAPLGCAAPPLVVGCAVPASAMPQPDGIPTYMVPGSTPMPIYPPAQNPTFVPGPTPLPGSAPTPFETPVPAPQGAMYYNSTALPHAMHVHPQYQAAEVPQGAQIQTPPELESPRPILTVPAESQGSPPPAPPAQDFPLPSIQPGSHYVPTGAATAPGPVRQAAAETRWTRGF